ncbi:MAG: carbamoyltransferase HypF [Methylomonas sp.]|nr:MAG: carbamoyltransferase HypF [Methylomonas sp.]
MPAKAIRARGVVQGVGFRPTIWRLAQNYRLTGSVWNDGEGVMIHVFGAAGDLAGFIDAIAQNLPPLARLDSLDVAELDAEVYPENFQISASLADGVHTPIAADAAVCPDCLADMADSGNRRYRYPFTNCTHCGPRFSVVRQIPYDREHTSMAVFAQCRTCLAEYADPASRRFHAQANCCPECGPKAWLEDGEQVFPAADPVLQAAEFIKQGFIVAVKGLGGFHLACDAANAEAVDKLRQRKRRYHKPFALMAKNPAMISRFAAISPMELALLQDRTAPVVLLAAQGEVLAGGVAPGDDKLGFMLPYTPLHVRLLETLDNPIVLTSGNISDEPQCTDNAEAKRSLKSIADYWLLHDRAIVNRLDDPVLRVMGGQHRVLRRGRGFAPEALKLPLGLAKADGVLAMGAELKNSFCLLKQGEAIVSQHLGDLENVAVQHDYREAIALYRTLFDFKPARIAIDYHPGYLSGQYGLALAEQLGCGTLKVQHHHAHLAACLAEHGRPLTAPPVLAAIFDGLGMGDDGTLWGGEFLLGDYKSYRRLARFQPIALPGGSQAMREPWRNLYAQIKHYLHGAELAKQVMDGPMRTLLAGKPLAVIDTMLAKRINSPPSSSCGRWFDAFAAALGVWPDQQHYEGQAAIALEVLATPEYPSQQAYPDAAAVEMQSGLLTLTWRNLWLAVLYDLQAGTSPGIIAARIHHSLITRSVALLDRLCRQTGADTIVLSGGVFQNRLLLEGLSVALELQGKIVLTPQLYPMNDGGLALGQAVIAATV